MLFLCPKGHSFQRTVAFTFTVSSANGDAAVAPQFTTKPVCPYCYLEWLEERFPTQVVVGEEIMNVQ